MRRRTLGKTEIKHPETGRIMRVKCMTGGGFSIEIEKTQPGQPVQPWAITRFFAGGATGTGLSLVPETSTTDRTR